MDEDVFTKQMAACPGDDDLRRVYADWLGGRSDDPRADARAIFLRSQVDGTAIPSSALTVLRDDDARWLAYVDRTAIARCTGSKRGGSLADGCPGRWEALEPSEEDALVRFCRTCRERVYYCASTDEAVRHALERRCTALAITSADARPFTAPTPGPLAQMPMIGRIGRSTGLVRLPPGDGDAVWYVGELEVARDDHGSVGQPIALTFQHVARCGPTPAREQVADRLRLVVPLPVDVDTDLWPQWRVPDDPGFSFTGRNLGAFDGVARMALTRFTRHYGAVTVRRRSRLRLPDRVFPDAPLVLVHWTAVPTDEAGLERELRWRMPPLASLVASLVAAVGR